MPRLNRSTDPRASASRRGYGKKWRKTAAEYVRHNPVCALKAEGCTGKAVVVDHRIPWDGNSKLFWDRSNWQPLCVNCHNVKTGAETAAKNAANPRPKPSWPLRYTAAGRPTGRDHPWNQKRPTYD